MNQKINGEPYHRALKLDKLSKPTTDELREEYKVALKGCVDELLKIHKQWKEGKETDEGWALNLKENADDGTEIRVYQKDMSKEDESLSGLNVTKIVSTVKAPMEDVMRWSTDSTIIPQFDDYFDQLVVYDDLTDSIEPLDKDSGVRAYGLARTMIFGITFVLKARDFVHLIGYEQLGKEHDNIGIAPMVSVSHPALPESNDYVRGFLINQGSIFIPNEDNTTTVITVNRVNMSGWIPDTLMNYMTQSTVQTRKMRDVMHGLYKEKQKK